MRHNRDDVTAYLGLAPGLLQLPMVAGVSFGRLIVKVDLPPARARVLKPLAITSVLELLTYVHPDPSIPCPLWLETGPITIIIIRSPIIPWSCGQCPDR